jgi:hypothetical protein
MAGKANFLMPPSCCFFARLVRCWAVFVSFLANDLHHRSDRIARIKISMKGGFSKNNDLLLRAILLGK